MATKVFYIDLNREETNQLNADPLGWGGELGSAYLKAKDGKFDGNNIKLVRMSAVVLDDSDPEQVWTQMQNGALPWTSRQNIQCLTDFPRSMDVGDLLLTEDGQVLRCATFGFEALQNPAVTICLTSMGK